MRLFVREQQRPVAYGFGSRPKGHSWGFWISLGLILALATGIFGVIAMMLAYPNGPIDGNGLRGELAHDVLRAFGVLMFILAAGAIACGCATPKH